MKIRQGFVSNSSSSSFIVSYEPGMMEEDLTIQLKNTEELTLSPKHMLYEVRNDLVREIVKLVSTQPKRIKKHFIKYEVQMEYGQEDELQEELKHIPNNHNIAVIDVDNHQHEVLANMQFNLVKDRFTILNRY